MQIIDGRKIQKEILEEIKKEVSTLSFVPIFCDVLVGEDKVSKQYVDLKAKMAEAVGIKFHHANFPVNISTVDLVKELEILNKISNMCGIIIQLPLPDSLDNRKVLDAIDSSLDVDCLGNGSSKINFPAALACIKLLDSLEVDLKNKKIIVLGQGELVGKPVTALLQSRGLEPIIITSKTENKEKIIKEADIIISGMGQGKYITGDMIKAGVVLIDAGTSESLGHSPTGEPNGGVVGDVDLESVKDVASFVSPVPGGVGPVTVAILLQNVLNVAKRRVSTDGTRHDFD